MKTLANLYAALLGSAPALRRVLPRHPWLWVRSPFVCAFSCFDFLRRSNLPQTAATGEIVDKDGSALPWLTLPAIEYLRRIDFSQKDVFEFGAGYSTGFFAERARSVTAVDDDGEWCERAQALAGGRATIIFASSGDFASAINRRPFYDIILIDGIPDRLQCAKAAVNRLAAGGVIIADNTDLAAGKSAAEWLESCGLLRVDFCGHYAATGAYGATSFFFDCEKTMRREPQP